MIVGIIGSGGREHAICHALNKSKKIGKIYCFPGNAGTDACLLYTSPSPRDPWKSRMPSSA